MESVSQLRYLLALAEEGNYRRAARKLGVSHSTLSSMVSRLEDKYGAEIFFRTRTQTKPTVFGELLINASRMALSAIQDAERGIEQLLKNETGTVVVGADPTISSGPVAVALGLALKEVPGANFRVLDRTWRVMEDLLRSNLIDLYVGFAPDNKASDLSIRSFYLPGPWAVCRKDHPLSQSAELRIEHLSQYPLAGGDAPDWFNARLQFALKDRFATLDDLQNVFLLSQDPWLTANLVAMTDAIGLLPVHVARDGIDKGQLVRLDTGNLPLPEKIEFVIARNSADILSPLAASFIRHLAIVLSGQ